MLPRQRIGRVSSVGVDRSSAIVDGQGNIMMTTTKKGRIPFCFKFRFWSSNPLCKRCVMVTIVLLLIRWWVKQHTAVVQTQKVDSIIGALRIENVDFQFTRNDNPPHLSTAMPLMAYLEPIDETWMDQKPLPSRSTSSSQLRVVEFPHVSCSNDRVVNFPVDEYPMDDPFLPWIHDYFPSQNGSYIQFVAQNKRRCNTGKDHQTTMKFWEPQMSLFQPVPIDVVAFNDKSSSVQDNKQSLASERKYRLGTSPDTATFPETRFICYFHNSRGQEATTFSEFSFNYEYVSWRKGKQTMMATTGKDADQFWLSQLLFRCPVPSMFQEEVNAGNHIARDANNNWVTQLWLDLVPIRTPARNGEYLFTQRHVGPKHVKETPIFNARRSWGKNHILPAVSDSGRWANLPICRRPTTRSHGKRSLPSKPSTSKTTHIRKPFRLVACTWTAASYTRRGDAVSVSDSARRLREWIVFHLMVGFDHLYVYDNSPDQQSSPLRSVAADFEERVTYHPWPCKICNNNRPNHPNPGERSSQYAAEASCRERYGPMTDWMAFIDTDEYLVPMTPQSYQQGNNTPTWDAVLDEMDSQQIRILKMKSSRAKPRHSLMEILDDQTTCKDTKPNFRTVPTEPCLGPSRNETFLRVYNCEFIKPPRPSRFARAMKQIYRPDFVLSHFVHYSTVTVDVAQYFAGHPASASGSNVAFVRNVHRKDWASPETFLDELTQGTLIHTRSVLAHETMRRSHECYWNSTYNCILGYPCPNSVEFIDGQYKQNIFKDESGNYCNCWSNERIESVLIPKLEVLLRN